LYIIKL